MKKVKRKRPTAKTHVTHAIHGEAIFKGKDTARILELMVAQGSASRAAFKLHQANPDIADSQIVKLLTPRYIGLNSWYLYGAISLTKPIPTDSNPVFGGKAAWYQLQRGELTKTEWQKRRNNRLLSRGDRNHSGNRDIRIKLGKQNKGSIAVINPAGRGLWMEGSVTIYNANIPAAAWEMYNIELNHIRGNRFKVTMIYALPRLVLRTLSPGCIAADCNPDRIAWVELNGEGNIICRGEILFPRATYAGSGKRDNDIRMAALELLNICKLKNKSLVLETLYFGKKHKRPKGKRRNRGFNRMRHNFCYRTILTACERRAAKENIPLKSVFAGYTSILGIAKYSIARSMNRHTAAAVVIGRRGLGIVKERQNFVIEKTKKISRGAALEPREVAKILLTTSGRLGTPISKGKKSILLKQANPARLTPLSITRLRNSFLRLPPDDINLEGTQRQELPSLGQKRVKNTPRKRVSCTRRLKHKKTDTSSVLCPDMGSGRSPLTRKSVDHTN